MSLVVLSLSESTKESAPDEYFEAFFPGISFEIVDTIPFLAPGATVFLRKRKQQQEFWEPRPI